MGLIVVDTSVLVALLDSGDAHHEHARTALEQAWADGATMLVPSIAYAETMVRPLECGGETLTTAEEFFATQTIVPIGRDEAREAARLRGLHRPWLRMPDALVLATGLIRDASIVTGDRRWATVTTRTTLIG